MPALLLVIYCLVAAGQDPFTEDLVRIANLDSRPRVVEKRLPSSLEFAGLRSDLLRVEFIIERNGTVQHVRPVGDGGTVLEFKTITGLLRRWMFSPGVKGGATVRTLATLTVAYSERQGGRRGGSRGEAVPPPPAAVAAWNVDGVVDDFADGAVRFGEAGLNPPRVKKDVKPVYPSGLLGANITGRVELEAVVLASGKVGRVRVISSSHPGFEGEALVCTRQWTFEPGTRAGTAVPVLIKIVLEFRNRK